MSHVVKTIKIKRGAKMHILANGAGRNLRSAITNHLNIRIMSTFVTGAPLRITVIQRVLVLHVTQQDRQR